MLHGLMHQFRSMLSGFIAGEHAGRRHGARDVQRVFARGRRAETAASAVRHPLKARITGMSWGALAVLCCLASPFSAAASVEGDVIVNRANIVANGQVLASATVSVTVSTTGSKPGGGVRTPSIIEFLQYAGAPDGSTVPGARFYSVGPTYYRTAADPAAPWQAMPMPVPLGYTSPIGLGAPIPLIHADCYHAGEPLFVMVTDHDQNQDPTVRETIVTTITDPSTEDTEVLRLVETGPDTGVFLGWIRSADAVGYSAGSSFNGVLPVAQGDVIHARYTDLYDGTDTTAAAAVVDPLGILFDSTTGAPLDGAKVTLFDVAANAPAVVHGEDNLAIFPSTVVTGSVAKDSTGRVYAFPPGGFRFPFITPGRYYQLKVTPPAGYVVPSVVPDADLKKLSGGPFNITTGSRGEPFLVNPGPPLRIDVPADHKSGRIWIQKASQKSQVALGDIVPYDINVQNNDSALGVAAVMVTDRLPQGFRYRKGSTKLGETAAADPTISSDGRTLVFNVGDLAAKASVILKYVVEVSAGTPLGISTNVAQATSGVTASNLASAQVEVRSDFLSSRSLIMGRVYNGACAEDPSVADKGVAGVRIYLEDGTFVDTDKNGMYHFEGVTPRAHVVQLDLDSLPEGYSAVPCEKNSRFAGRAYSQFVEVQGGTMWRADFHLARSREKSAQGLHEVKPAPPAEEEEESQSPAEQESESVGIDLQSALSGPQVVEYQLRSWGGAEKTSGKRLHITLPPGVSYLPGSSNVNGAAAEDPSVEGSTVRYALPDTDSEWVQILRLRAKLTPAASKDDLLTRAELTFTSAAGAAMKTPTAENVLATVRSEKTITLPDVVLHPHFRTLGIELNAEDRAALDELALMLKVLKIEQITISGHTDNVKIARHNRGIYPDNAALSAARAQSVGKYLKEKLHLPPEKMEYFGYGERRPVASNRSAAGRSENRRVEIRVRTARLVENVELELKRAQSGLQQVAVAKTEPAAALLLNVQKEETAGEEESREKAPEAAEAAAPAAEGDAAAQPSIKEEPGILTPAKGSVLIYPINGVRICLPSALTPKLTVDGKEISADRIGFTMKDPKTAKALYSYIGVDFGAPGEHTVELAGLDPFGNARFSQSVKVIRNGGVAAMRIKSAADNVADGKTPVRLQIELLDGSGNPVAAAADLEIKDGELKPFKAPGPTAEPNAGQAERVHVDAQGNALFQPVTRSGLYRVSLALNGAKLDAETYVKPQLRKEWLLVGIAEGTVGYNAISGHMESLEGSGLDEKFYDNERVAFYAKGTIKGEWLLTASFDSKKQKSATGNGLFQTIDPNTYYTLYGDASKQQYDAASVEKLYLKIERDEFYALFGDYDTGLTVTELSRYSRRLNGVKTELHGKKVEITAFGSQTGQSYVKDEIQGDGTSGIYHLSRRGIVINSDKITLEIRDRFRNEIIISSRALSRFTDYSIDYDSGTVLFKEPIYNRDDQFNPIFIVAEYESQQGSSNITAGGRAGVKLFEDKVKAGVTYVHEGQANGKGESIGVDTTVKLGQTVTLKAEAAHTDTSFGTTTSRNAYLAEISHKTATLDTRVYYREIDNGFGLGQQQGSEVGTRKMGADAVYKLTESVAVNGQAKREYNLSTGAERDMVEAKANYNAGNYGATLGARYANDLLGDGTSKTSSQVSLGANWLTLNKKLTLKVSRDQSIGQGNNVDYPTRTMVGADYKITEQVSAFAQQEFTEGGSSHTNMTRAGLKSTPWQGGTVNSSVERNLNENQDRLFALFGLKQTWKLTERWTVDAGLDRSQTLKNSYTINANSPPASGTANGEDFTAVSVGADYKRIDWSWNIRTEVRTADSEDKWGVMSSLLGEPMEGWGWSARLQVFQTDGAQNTLHGDLRLGLVHRPLQSRWIILDRLDLIVDRLQGSSTTNTNDRRVVNNLNANYRPSRRMQVSFQYGSKYVMQSVEGSSFSGYTDLIGAEGRYDMTEKWDLGARGSLLHSWSTQQLMSSCGLSLGYNVVQNAWLSVGYNLTGFSDKDFSKADYTAQGPYLRFRFKFDQNSVRDGLKAINL